MRYFYFIYKNIVIIENVYLWTAFFFNDEYEHHTDPIS